MDEATLIAQAKRIADSCGSDGRLAVSALVQARELTRSYAGEKSAFYLELQEVKTGGHQMTLANRVRQVLDGFVKHIENGLAVGASVERQARIDVVSDILEQAQQLLDSRGVHPGAPAMLVGAALEEFLRNWVEDAALDPQAKKPGIDTYCGLLRGDDLISKQDVKDITSWAGIRNHAAHGEWNEVGDKLRIGLMLEGVNLFMRKYGAREPAPQST